MDCCKKIDRKEKLVVGFFSSIKKWSFKIGRKKMEPIFVDPWSQAPCIVSLSVSVNHYALDYSVTMFVVLFFLLLAHQGLAQNCCLMLVGLEVSECYDDVLEQMIPCDDGAVVEKNDCDDVETIKLKMINREEMIRNCTLVNKSLQKTISWLEGQKASMKTELETNIATLQEQMAVQSNVLARSEADFKVLMKEKQEATINFGEKEAMFQQTIFDTGVKIDELNKKLLNQENRTTEFECVHKANTLRKNLQSVETNVEEMTNQLTQFSVREQLLKEEFRESKLELIHLENKLAAFSLEMKHNQLNMLDLKIDRISELNALTLSSQNLNKTVENLTRALQASEKEKSSLQAENAQLHKNLSHVQKSLWGEVEKAKEIHIELGGLLSKVLDENLILMSTRTTLEREHEAMKADLVDEMEKNKIKEALLMELQDYQTSLMVQAEMMETELKETKLLLAHIEHRLNVTSQDTILGPIVINKQYAMHGFVGSVFVLLLGIIAALLLCKKNK